MDEAERELDEEFGCAEIMKQNKNKTEFVSRFYDGKMST